jgi:hypothetical protein
MGKSKVRLSFAEFYEMNGRRNMDENDRKKKIIQDIERRVKQDFKVVEVFAIRWRVV